jgi:putative ABC transport system permease protein
MNALGFAWRSLVRQPARAALGVLGVAAVGALLFDMLLLSQGLVVSMRDLLDRYGWDVRVTGGDLPRQGPRIHDGFAASDAIAKLPSVAAVLLVRLADAQVEPSPGSPRAEASNSGESRSSPLAVSFQGVVVRSTGTSVRPPWTILRGRDAAAAEEVVVSESIASAATVGPGSTLTVRASCASEREALPPTTMRVTGVAEFPFASATEDTLGGTFDALKGACAGNIGDEMDVMLVTSKGDPEGTASAIRAVRPDLSALTNEEVVGRLQQTSFSYFRQISVVLTAVTVSFAVLLITVLLTVSVNQRLGEIAALRALGFSRWRVIKDVLSESALIVGTGGLLSLPLGQLLATGLDRILKGMPSIPADLHFFVFEREALAGHLSLLVATALIAALYPMRIVSRLPIAATLRDEVIG